MVVSCVVEATTPLSSSSGSSVGDVAETVLAKEAVFRLGMIESGALRKCTDLATRPLAVI